MTLRFIDSFDHYATADLPLKYAVNNVCSISAGNGRRGAALSLTLTSYLLKVIDSQQTWIVGFAIKMLALTSPNVFLSFIDLVGGGASQVDIRINSSGFLFATRNGTTLGTATTGALVANTYYYVEAKVKISSSVGTVDIQVNGSSVLSLSSQNTQSGSNATSTEW